MAPVIFNLFLVAVTLACRSDLPSDAGVPFIYRADGKLFNLRRLKADTKVSRERIYELQYADDAALPAHSAADLQNSLDTLSTAYRRAGLVVNAKKTEVLSSVDTHVSPVPSFSVHGDVLSNVSDFTYLGSILSDSCSLDSEVEHCIKAASSAFGRLTHSVFLEPCRFKMNLQGCLRLSPTVWLWGVDPLPVTHQGPRGLSHVQPAEHPWCPLVAQSISHWAAQAVCYNTSWTSSPTETTALARACNQNAWEPAPSSAALRWALIGATIRRPPEEVIHWPHQMNLRMCNIKPCDLETLASDRVVWQATCEVGLAHFASDWLAASEERRAVRHTPATKPKTGPQCPHCGRTCASQFGLQSHLRTHWPQHSTTQ